MHIITNKNTKTGGLDKNIRAIIKNAPKIVPINNNTDRIVTTILLNDFILTPSY